MSGRGQGLGAWLLQRFSAIYLALYLLGFGVAIIWCPPADHIAWRNWLASPVVNAATGLFFVALATHAWVGMRDIIMDYIKPAPVRVTVLGIVLLILGAYLLWALRVLMTLG